MLFLHSVFKQTTSRNPAPLTELQELCEWEQCYLGKEIYIAKAFLNYDVISYTFRDIKDDLKNLSTRKVVLTKCKYINEY